MTSFDTSKHSVSLEERLQPWIDQAEYIIVFIIITMTWAAGWVNLLAFESFNPVIAGRYSLSFAAFFLIYSSGFVGLFWLMTSLQAIERFKQMILFFQRRPFAFLLVCAGMLAIIWSMMVIDWWSVFPLIEINALVIMGAFVLLVLLATPEPDAPFQSWRKIGLGLLIVLLLIEAVLQGMAYFRVLPFDTLRGLTVPNGRIYQTDQGFVNTQTNNYGWFYPDFRLETDSHRILINGDRYVAATQIDPQNHFGQRIEAALTQSNTFDAPEVMAQGQNGYGAEMYLNPTMDVVLWQPLNPDEVIVVVHLANDMDIDPGESEPRVVYARGITPFVELEDFETWHTRAHLTMGGHDAPNPLDTLATNSLLWTAINVYLFNLPEPVQPLHTDSATPDAPFGEASYLFDDTADERAARTLNYMALELDVFHDYMADRDIGVKLVTLPYFPAEFYSMYSNSDWQTQLNEYDILRPEDVLQTVADENNMPFLSMGQWMQQDNVTVEEIQSFFFNDGTGYLTETGHDYLADAIVQCFYSSDDSGNNVQVRNGCMNR